MVVSTVCVSPVSIIYYLQVLQRIQSNFRLDLTDEEVHFICLLSALSISFFALLVLKTPPISRLEFNILLLGLTIHPFESGRLCQCTFSKCA